MYKTEADARKFQSQRIESQAQLQVHTTQLQAQAYVRERGVHLESIVTTLETHEETLETNFREALKREKKF